MSKTKREKGWKNYFEQNRFIGNGFGMAGIAGSWSHLTTIRRSGIKNTVRKEINVYPEKSKIRASSHTNTKATALEGKLDFRRLKKKSISKYYSYSESERFMRDEAKHEIYNNIYIYMICEKWDNTAFIVQVGKNCTKHW